MHYHQTDMGAIADANLNWQSRVKRVFELGQSLNAGLELPDLCQRVVDAAISLSDAQSGLLILNTLVTSQYSIRATVRESGSLDYMAVTVDDEPVAAYMLRQTRPVILNTGDVVGDDGIDYEAECPEIFIPIINQGDLAGVLGVKRAPNDLPFPEDTVDLLLGLVGYAAVSLENAFLYQRAIELSRELSLLVESSNAISSSLDLTSVLNAIARYMTRALDTHWCIIYSSVSPENDCFVRLAEYRNAVWKPGRGPSIEPSSIVRDPDSLLLEPFAPIQRNLHGSEEEVAALKKRRVSRTLIVPLQVEGKVIGVAELVNQNESTPYTSAQIGQSLRFALELASLHGEKNFGEQRQRLIETSRVLLYNLNADWCNLYLFDGDRQGTVKWLSYGTGIWLEDSGPVLTVNVFPTLTIVTREQRIAVLRSTDPDLPQPEVDLFRPVGTGAILALPLVLKGKTVGLVQLFDLDPEREFPSRELALAYTLASQAAAALENARLVLDLQHSLTELKAMQGRLIHTARLSALGELAAVVAHQVNNPLTTVMGDAEILVQDIDKDHPNHASAEAILHAGRRAKDVVERILVMSRDEREFKDLDLNATIEDALQLVRPQASRHRIKLIVRTAEDIPLVYAIPGQLEDVWMNLLTNSRDAVLQRNPKQGVITITSALSEDGKMAVVTVSDNGSGIPAAHLESVFDPLFTTKPRGKGTGLGLYVCRQIVDDHKGMITINSVPNEGTMITVQIPITTSLSKEV
jgi:signal transduction histidine kinase